MSTYYVFGYGSLLDYGTIPDSQKPDNIKPPQPVRLQEKILRRGWWAPGTNPGFNPTFLGAVRSSDGPPLNGIIYEVNDSGMAYLNQRESNASMATLDVKGTDFQWLNGREDPLNEKVIVYYNKYGYEAAQGLYPSKSFPIVQSYLDICLTGALDLEESFPGARDFSREFIESTEGWSRFWVNDRIYPRRPFFMVRRAGDIDWILSATPTTAALFQQIELEPACWEDRNPRQGELPT